MSLAAVESRPNAVFEDIFVTLSGKITEHRTYEGTNYYTLVRPAPDEFSSPQPYEVRSDTQLGRVGSMVEVRCKLTGYFKRTYEQVNRQTGETRRVKPIAVAFDAVN